MKLVNLQTMSQNRNPNSKSCYHCHSFWHPGSWKRILEPCCRWSLTPPSFFMPAVKWPSERRGWPPRVCLPNFKQIHLNGWARNPSQTLTCEGVWEMQNFSFSTSAREEGPKDGGRIQARRSTSLFQVGIVLPSLGPLWIRKLRNWELSQWPKVTPRQSFWEPALLNPGLYGLLIVQLWSFVHIG